MTFNDLKEYYGFLKENPNFTGVCVILHPNGKKWYEYNYVDGKVHGKQFGWHNNGKKWFEYNYVNGYRIGFHFYDGGKPYEMKLGKNNIWYIIVKETL